jgi:predicted nuclease of predicted toxin-antitoxin system
MRWLLHGKFDPTVAEALHAHGHQTRTLAEMGVAEDAAGEEVLAAAQKAQLDLLTADADTATRPFETKSPFGRCIALLTEESMQAEAIGRFFERYPRPAPGRLYTITPSRVKVRQLPGRK